ncbi:DegV family protein [Bacillus sp. PS06]|uniref:DegV family protein n=1 Tax=Bacillus sp. PS06 TaxID=2764176 RepID=UPI00177F5194|nr:DegV family protein [Bacillus sp. PS06]MBD8067634.1 DegV family protein [Bacillus sp. PS06]
MERKVAFVTDSTVYLSKELQEHPDVYVVPIVVISEGREYEDGIDLSSEQLYDIIRNNKEVPKTSQPSVGRFVQLYEQLQKEYDYVISIHVSSKLSGTVSSAAAATNHVDLEIEIIDSLSISYGMSELILKGIQLIEQNLEIKDVVTQLKKQVATCNNFVLISQLEQLYKGGRMSGAQFLLGNLLQIRPILTINPEGELGLFDRVRSEKKALSKIIELLKQSCEEHHVKQIGIMHGQFLEKAMEIKQKIEEVIPEIHIVIGEVSSSIAVHAGEGAIALFWYQE